MKTAQKAITVFGTSALMMACAAQEREPAPHDPKEQIEAKVAQLQGQVSQINALVLSDWAACEVGGPDDLSQLQQNMCEIAQASTVEARLDLQSKLQQFANQASERIKNLQNQLENSGASVVNIENNLFGSSSGATCSTPDPGSVCAQVNDLESRLSTIEGLVNDPNSGINALNNAVADLNSKLNDLADGVMRPIEIGVENITAGPLYETILINPNRSRMTAYFEAAGSAATVATNGFSVSPGSSIVTVQTNSAHGYQVGETIEVYGARGFSGIEAGDINGSFTIQNVPNSTELEIDVGVNATNASGGGGQDAYLKHVLGRGLGIFWKTGDGQSTFTTTLGSQSYNFLVTGSSTQFANPPGAGALPDDWSSPTPGEGFVCYDVAAPQASTNVILSGGGNIICK